MNGNEFGGKPDAAASDELSVLHLLVRYDRDYLAGTFNGRSTVISLLIWLIIGGVVGWLAGLIMRDNNSVLVNIIVGIVGSFLGGLILSRGDINNSPLTLGTFAVSLLGAVILLAIVNLVRRGSIRS